MFSFFSFRYFYGIILFCALTPLWAEKKEASIIAHDFSSASHLSPPEALLSYSAEYDVFYDHQRVGSAKERLNHKKIEWIFSIDIQLKKLFFSIYTSEINEFLLLQHSIRPLTFSSRSKQTFKKAYTIQQNFNWIKHIETGQAKKKSWTLPFTQKPLLFDRRTHLFQLKIDVMYAHYAIKNKSFHQTKNFHYWVSHKGKRTLYTYKMNTSDSHNSSLQKNTMFHFIQTPMRKPPFKSISLTRTKKNGDQFHIWFAPELHYFPVKITQKEKKKSEISFVLKALHYEL
jgi:hypothetical protein